MKKIIYLILTLVLSLATAVSLVACGGDDKGGDEGGSKENEKVTYTVTAVDTNGNPIKDVEVKLCIDGAKGVPFKTDKDGKITYTTAKSVEAMVGVFPSGYAYDKVGKKQQFDAKGNLVLTFSLVDVVTKMFEIKVVDQDGNAVEGVTVQICDAAGACRTPQETDENGEAFYNFVDGTFYASLTNGLEALPEGYTVADPEAKYYFEDNTVTIEIEKLN